MASNKKRVFQTAFNRYEGKESIGNGGAGTVFRAVAEDGEECAVKVLRESLSDKLKRFHNEYRWCLDHQHQGIIRPRDHGLWDNGNEEKPFYVMPLYAGSLRTLMDNGIDPERAMIYFGQILEAVEAAHLWKAVHRDIKPENFLYDDKSDRLILADFGIAHFLKEDLYTMVDTSPGDRLANFQYAAPEQIMKGRSVDHRADIFALGLILNELFTGHVPHGTDYATIGSIKEDYQYVDALVSKMIQQNPENRFQSIEDAKKELIGHKNEFISFQRLSALKKTVIPVTDLDDPLVVDPPQVVDADWRDGQLILTLSQPVNEDWRWALLNMGGTHNFQVQPQYFTFDRNIAMIDVPAHMAQNAIDLFKEWLPRANQVYESTLQREVKAAAQKARRELEEEIAREEERQKVLSSLKI